MLNRIGLVGLAFAGVLAACGGEETLNAENEISDAKNVEHDAQLAESEDASTSACSGPMNAHADWIESTRTGSPWCINCSYVSVEITNLYTGSVVLNQYAALDQVSYSSKYGFTYRTYVRGTWYTPNVSVHMQGN